MSSDPIPGGGPDGERPVPPAPGGVPGDGGAGGPAAGPGGDGGWDAGADLARLLDDIDAGREQVPPEDGEPVPAVWFSLAGTTDPAQVDLAGLAQGGPLGGRAPDAVLAAMADMACDPAVLKALSDDQVLGLAGAGRRLEARGAWIRQAAVAEFAARRAEPDAAKAQAGFVPFAADELAPELVITTAAAEEAMIRAQDAARRLVACTGLLRDGRISDFQLKIITDATQCLSDDGAAEADLLLAAAAPALTPGRLRAMCTRIVLLIDPQTAQRRKDAAAKDARVIRFQEDSGNAALCGRDLPPDQVLASSAHIDACARQLRAGGVPGTLEQLRALAFLDLTKGRDPLARLTATADGAGGEPGQAGQAPGSGGQDAADDAHDEPDDAHDGDDGHGHGDGPGDGPGDGGRPPGGPAGPGGSAPGRRPEPSDKAPVKATITLLVPAGTLLGWSDAPGEIPGFGLLDPATTRDMTTAAAAHPKTRWCVTVIGADGTAAAHGCAPGPRPWTPGPGPPPTTPGGQAEQVTALLRRLRVQLSPIAKGECDHRHHSGKYVISRNVKHLIQARAATCTAPCCNRPAADGDADHTTPWPHGPSCECNLGAPCRYHHRNKQAPGWRLEQPQPGVMVWTTPSGRIHTTYPTKYLI